MESAIRSLLIHDKNSDPKKFEYHIFDFFQIKLHIEEDYISFEMLEDQKGFGVSKNELEIFFEQFCVEKFGKSKDRWSYLEFKEHINDLKMHFVDKDLGDDPFCSYLLEFLELDIDPNTVQLLEFIRGEDHVQKHYKVISCNEKKMPEKDYDGFEMDGDWCYSWHYTIKVPM